MAARAQFTILSIHAGFIARADFSGSPRPALIKVWRQSRPTDLSFPDLVQAALQLGPRCAPRVWVLSEDVWTQTLAMPTATISGLDDVQLIRAFAFESEPLSGIAGTEAAIGYSPVERTDEFRTFCISSIETAVRDQVQAVVRKAGAKLAAILHPGGANSPVSQVPGTHSWRRIEMWRQATICVGGTGHVRNRLQIVNANNAQPRVQASVTAWIAADPTTKHSEVLEAEGRAEKRDAGESGEPRLTLLSDADLGIWLTTWANVLTAAAPQAPLIVPVPQPIPRHWFILAGLAAEAAVLALCYAHWFVNDRKLAEITRDSEVYIRSNKQAADMDKRKVEVAHELEALTEKNAHAQKVLSLAQNDFERQRNRIALVLKSLAEQRPEDLMIQSIEGDGSTTLVKGISLRSSLPDELAAKLETVLKPAGVFVQPLDKKASHLQKNGGPWEFTLSLTLLDDGALDAPKTPVIRHGRPQ